MMRFVPAVAAVTLLVCSPGEASAQPRYPAKPVRIVVPFAPGAGTDLIGRTFAQKLQDALGQSFIVDNRSGASGNISADIVARAAADGYTLMVHSSTYATNAALEAQQSSGQRIAAIDPLFRLDKGPQLIVLYPALPVNSISELVALAKAKPGQLSFASGGTSSIGRFATEAFMAQTKTSMVHVPYKGLGPAIVDLVGGNVQVLFGSLPSVLSHVKSNRLRAIAVTSAERSEFVPQLPTVAESGVPGYVVELWIGLFGPPRLPNDVIGRLDSELRKILELPDVRQRLANEGVAPAPLSAPDFRKVVAEEITMWRKVVVAAGIRVE